MLNRRWWDVATIAALAVTLLLAALNPPYGLDDLGLWITALAFAVTYFAYLRRRIGSEDARHHVISTVLLAVLLFFGTMFEANFSTMQTIAYPYVWVTAPSTRRAIAANVVIAVAVGAGVAIDLASTDPVEAVFVGVGIAALSLTFSIALGLWITHIASVGEERARLLAELQATQGQLAALHRDAGVNDERARLAREIHDTIAQSLTGLVMVAQRAGNRLAGAGDASSDTAAARADVELIEQMAREALTEARGLVATLAPVSADGGLAAALGRLGEAFERETGVRVEVDADASGLDRELEVVLLRSAQEGLANVRKHSDASRVAITVSRDADDVVLTVHDDGRGPTSRPAPAPSPDVSTGAGRRTVADGESAAPAPAIRDGSTASGLGREGSTDREPARPDVRPGGFGIAGLRDRAALVGGTVEFGADPGGGALLRVTVPRKEPA